MHGYDLVLDDTIIYMYGLKANELDEKEGFGLTLMRELL